MRLLRAGLWPLSIITVLAAAWIVPMPLYLERPGRLLSLASCVTVESPRAEAVEGDYLLTTVNLLPASMVDTLRGIVDDDIAVVARTAVVPPQLDSDEFFDQQQQLFSSTAEVAAAIGLRAAGMEAEIGGDGVLVRRTLPGSPADGVLAAGDVITALEGTPLRTDGALREALAGAPAGAPVAVTFTREDRVREAFIVPTELAGRPILGVEVQTLNPRVDLPVPVTVDSGTIGGPSAGLMIAVTVYDKVTPRIDLAAGRRVAGTGSIDGEGRIGPIGGIRQKVIAAERDGADLFLAPASQLAEAEAGLSGPSLDVVGVADFDDAVRALRDTASGQAAGTSGAGEPPACPFADAA